MFSRRFWVFGWVLPMGGIAKRSLVMEKRITFPVLNSKRLGFALGLVLGMMLWSSGASAVEPGSLADLTGATVLTRPGALQPAEDTAAMVLIEEVAKRTGVTWKRATEWPSTGPVIVVTARVDNPGFPRDIPARQGEGLPETRPEGYRVMADMSQADSSVVWVIGSDQRGALFGVGRLLRRLVLSKGAASVDAALDICSAPMYPMRGHQLGYRHTANSYDAWGVAQYEQYIRELALFGTNCIETIPGSGKDNDLMPIPREVMDAEVSKICMRYGLDYWVWLPVEVDLNDAEEGRKLMDTQAALLKSYPRLDAVFIPGGDPGENPPALLMPYAAELAGRVRETHPEVKLWISLQGFDKEKTDAAHEYIDKNMPDWLGGLAVGPSSPPMAETRRRLPKPYGLRHYPDITHNLICQYPVYWWDQAYALTLGREACNPQPAWYTHVHNWFAGYTDGFLTYSDGVHDDVNKVVWSLVGWDPTTSPRESAVEYARVFFRCDMAEEIGDGILALEKNWEGILANNGAVEATLRYWLDLEAKAPELRDNWRWQILLMRAHYDAYTRKRFIYEQGLEKEANAALADAGVIGADNAMDAALALLEQATPGRCQPEWRARIEQLCEELFKSIGLQTSVERHGARNGERGAVLDYVDVPLNNRWWLEDEFARIRGFASEEEKVARLNVIRTWEQPGPGSFYDDIGNVAKSPHVAMPPGPFVEPNLVEERNPHFPWTDNGYSRTRRSWLCFMRWPQAMEYYGLDPEADYVLRLTGPGDAFPRANGEKLTPSVYSKTTGEFKEFPIPKNLVQGRELRITFDDIDENHLNWREWSYLAEVWLIRK